VSLRDVSSCCFYSKNRRRSPTLLAIQGDNQKNWASSLIRKPSPSSPGNPAGTFFISIQRPPRLAPISALSANLIMLHIVRIVQVGPSPCSRPSPAVTREMLGWLSFPRADDHPTRSRVMCALWLSLLLYGLFYSRNYAHTALPLCWAVDLLRVDRSARAARVMPTRPARSQRLCRIPVPEN
jgi:hypothetical protein